MAEAARVAPELHVVEGADHGFHVLKRSGRTDREVSDELCRTLARWAGGAVAGQALEDGHGGRPSGPAEPPTAE